MDMIKRPSSAVLGKLTTKEKSFTGAIQWLPSKKEYKIILTVEGSPFVSHFALDRVETLSIPRPRELDSAAVAFKNGKYDLAIKDLTPLLYDYLMLQHDVEIATLLAKAHLIKDNHKEAVGACEYVISEKSELAWRGTMASVYWTALKAHGEIEKRDRYMEKAINSGLAIDFVFWDELMERNKNHLIEALIKNTFAPNMPKTIPFKYWKVLLIGDKTDIIGRLIENHINVCENIPLDYFNAFINRGKIEELDQLLEKTIKTKSGIPPAYWTDPLVRSGKNAPIGTTTLLWRFIFKSIEFKFPIPDEYASIVEMLFRETMDQYRMNFAKEINQIKGKYNANCKQYADQFSLELQRLKELYVNAGNTSGVDWVNDVKNYQFGNLYEGNSKSRTYSIASYDRKFTAYGNSDFPEELRQSIRSYNNMVHNQDIEEARELIPILSKYQPIFRDLSSESTRKGWEDLASRAKSLSTSIESWNSRLKQKIR
jgi:hypothetical protein